MTIGMNEFKIAPEKGLLTLLPNVNTYNVKANEALIAGQAVKLVDVAGEVIVVEKADVNTDDIFGFVALSVEQSEYEAGQMLKASSDNCVMYMEASEAIAVGTELEVVIASDKIAVATAGTVIGKALGKATADGDLIPVLIKA